MKKIYHISIIIFVLIIVVSGLFFVHSNKLSNQSTGIETKNVSSENKDLLKVEDDLSIKIINDFFGYLNVEEYENAYKIYNDTDNLGYEFFKKRYSNAYKVNTDIRYIEKLETNKYQFSVSYFTNGTNESKSAQKMIGIIQDNKISLSNPELKNISSLTIGNQEVLLKKSGLEEVLTIKEQDKETVIDAYSSFGYKKNIVNLTSSNTGRYLTYKVNEGIIDYSGVEYAYVVYDLDNKKLFEIANPDVAIFSKNDKYLLACANFKEASAPFILLYSLNGMKKIEISKNPMETECSYDKSKNVFNIKYSEYENGKANENPIEKVLEFNTLTGQFQEK